MARERDDWNDEEFALQRIEAMVRAAGNYVVPSDELRASTIEVARDLCGLKATYRKVRNALLLMTLLLCVIPPLIFYLQQLPLVPTAMSAAEAEQQALELTEQPAGDPSWGLADVFQHQRFVPASFFKSF